MCTVNIYLLSKDISRLTDGANNIVGFHRLFTGKVLNLVVSLIEGGADEVGKASINNAELLNVPFFYI